MMTREQLFEHLMQHDAEFRKEVVSSATVAGMDLYQAALSMLNKDEKNDALASATNRTIDADQADELRQGPNARSKAAKTREKKRKSPEARAKQREANKRIQAALLKIITAHGPLSMAEIRPKLHPKTAALVTGSQHLHNAMYALKTAKQIRWTRGSKRPNVKWEIVP